MRAGTAGFKSTFAARGTAFLTPLLAVVAGFASVMHLYPKHSVFPTYDSAAYVFVADGMLKGRIPYVQLWENKGLPLYALNIVGRLMTPGGYLGIWLLELLFMSLAFGAIIWTLRRVASTGASVLATVLLILGIVLTGAGGDTPEYWSIALQGSGLVAAWLLVSGEWRAKRWLFVLTGFAAAMAGMMKINLLGTWIALFVLLVALTVKRRIDVPDALRLLGMMAGGFFVAAALSVGPIIAWGATRPWLDQWIGFGGNMKEHGITGTRPSRIGALGVGLYRCLFISVTFAVGVVAALVDRVVRKLPWVESARLWMAGFLTVWLGIELWASSINGLDYIHYSMPWLVPMVMLVAMLFGGEDVRWPRLALALAVVVAVVSLAVVVPEFSARLNLHRGFPPVMRDELNSRRAAQNRMIRQIKSRTTAADTIFVWGMDPIVFAETGRLSAGPYGHALDVLLTPGYQSEQQFAALMRDLEEQKPRLIIDSSALRQDGLSIADLRVSAPKDSEAGRLQPYMHSLPDFVAAHYRRVAVEDPRVNYYELIGN